MSTLSTTEEFLSLYQKSDLHDQARFAQHFPDGAALPPDPRDCAAALVQAGLLTAYQSKQLLLGKYKGFVLGSYKILQPLGQGGMGAVFLAEHIAMKRRVALKVVQTDKSQDKLALERFHREARSAAALDHPNIVRLFDVGQQAKVSYLAMEYVDGDPLDTLLDKGEPPPYSQAVAYVVQAAAGLQHAHEKGMVHRDIKPHNLMVTKDGTVKLLDMGLARCYQNEADNLTGSLGTENEAVGTADYVSPEQALNKELDARSDIYSLGATLYALIAGFPPFQGNMLQKLAQHQTVDPTPLASLREEVPEGLSDVVLKMMAKKPSKRYASAEEVIEALGPWLPGAKRRPTAVAAEVVAVAAVVPSRLIEQEGKRRSRAVHVRKPQGGFGGAAWAVVGGSVLLALAFFVGAFWLVLRPAKVTSEPVEEARPVLPPPAPPPPVAARPPSGRSIRASSCCRWSRTPPPPRASRCSPMTGPTRCWSCPSRPSPG
ncbi:MAG: serine/threonine-protein kinase [Gemmataceae bacterium]